MRKCSWSCAWPSHSLVAHKMRSFLTMLGVVIGVGAVIALVAVGQGTQAQVVNQFQSLGSNLLTVTAGTNFGFSRRRPAAERSGKLTNTDVDAIRGLATSVALIAPEYNASNANVSYAGKTASPSISGVTDEYARCATGKLTRGRFISAGGRRQPGDGGRAGPKQRSRTCSAARSVNPIGETIRINRQNYEVIGVLKAKGQSGPTNQDDVIFLPLADRAD